MDGWTELYTVLYCVWVYRKLREPLDDLDEIGRHAHGCDCAAGTVCVCC